MAQGHSNVRQVGDRIEVLLGELRQEAPPQVGAKVEEVIGLLVELYGAGLPVEGGDGLAQVELDVSVEAHAFPSQRWRRPTRTTSDTASRISESATAPSGLVSSAM